MLTAILHLHVELSRQVSSVGARRQQALEATVLICGRPGALVSLLVHLYGMPQGLGLNGTHRLHFLPVPFLVTILLQRLTVARDCLPTLHHHTPFLYIITRNPVVISD